MTLKKEILKLITKITKSCAATEQLKSLAGKSLLSVAATRWNSFFLVCDRLIDVKEHVIAVCNSKDWPIMFKWSEVRTIRDLLQPFAQVCLHFLYLL